MAIQKNQNPVSVKARAIPSLLSTLEANITGLEDAIGQLGKKMEMTLDALPPQEKTGEIAPEGRSMLASTLKGLSDRVSAATREVNSLMERTEL